MKTEITRLLTDVNNFPKMFKNLKDPRFASKFPKKSAPSLMNINQLLLPTKTKQ